MAAGVIRAYAIKIFGVLGQAVIRIAGNIRAHRSNLHVITDGGFSFDFKTSFILRAIGPGEINLRLSKRNGF